MRPADLTALAPATLADRAGVPAGVFVIGDARGIGKMLADSDTLRKLSFSGSTELGRILMAHARRR